MFVSSVACWISDHMAHSSAGQHMSIQNVPSVQWKDKKNRNNPTMVVCGTLPLSSLRSIHLLFPVGLRKLKRREKYLKLLLYSADYWPIVWRLYVHEYVHECIALLMRSCVWQTLTQRENKDRNFCLNQRRKKCIHFIF